MTVLLRGRGVRAKRAPSHPGAQTGRRGDAGPAGGLLGGKGPTGRFLWQFGLSRWTIELHQSRRVEKRSLPVGLELCPRP